MSNPVITAALTGPVATKADNQNLPTTPEEIAAAAAEAHAAGAAVVQPLCFSVVVTCRSSAAITAGRAACAVAEGPSLGDLTQAPANDPSAGVSSRSAVRSALDALRTQPGAIND
jgi:beta-keto acid cleavage enzyme